MPECGVTRPAGGSATDRFLSSPAPVNRQPTNPKSHLNVWLCDACKAWLFAGILVLGFAASISAQTLSILALPDRSSPRDWVASFLIEADRLTEAYSLYQADRTFANAKAIADQLDVMRGFLDLSSVPAAFRDKVGGEAATELIDILNRLPQGAILSGPPDPVGSDVQPDFWTIPGTEIVLARQTDGWNAGAYLVPHDILVQVPSFHTRIISAPLLRVTRYSDVRSEQMQATGPLVPQSLVNFLPNALKRPILGTPIWKQILVAGLFFVVLWLNVCWSRIARRAVNRLPEAIAGLFRLSGPVVLATSFGLFYFFIEYQLNVQGLVAIGALLVRNLSLIATGAWLVWTVTMIFTEMLIGSGHLPDERLDAHLMQLVGRIVATVGATAAVIFGLSSVGIPAAGLITSLGVGGIGIALAARVTIENLFGGLVLLIDRPFRVGDWIEIGAGSGRVKDIGGRSCRIETAEGTQIVIPNSVLSAQPITNLGRGPNHRLKQVLPLPKGMSRVDIERRLATVRTYIAACPKLDSPKNESAARLIEGPEGTLQVEIDVPVNADSASDFYRIRTETLLVLHSPTST